MYKYCNFDSLLGTNCKLLTQYITVNVCGNKIYVIIIYNNHHNTHINHQKRPLILSLSFSSCIVLPEMILRPPSLKRRKNYVHHAEPG